MIVIGVCDGDTAVRVMLSGFIRRYREETGLAVQVLSYDDGEKLLLHYPFEMDLVFLEIPFTRMNGIEIAKRIRRVDEHVGIVFLTTLLHHVLEAYEVRADNYLIKPLQYARFLREVEQARTRRGQNRFFIERNADGVYKVYTKSILYVETSGQNTLIHTESETVLSHRRMKEHEQVLFETFFARCHAGFIVNLLHFEKMETGQIVLFTGDRIPVSRSRRAAVLEGIKRLYSGEA